MDASKMEICAILPAAGSGERMGLSIPKQYVYVSHRPLIFHTILGFLQLNWIKQIIVIAAPESIEMMTQTLSFFSREHRHRVQVTHGAKSRHESIYLGLKFLKSLGIECDLVVIHDAVRPIVDKTLLKEVVCAAKKHGASGVMCPLTSTVIATTENSLLNYALDRNMFKASEMPQAFNYSLILDTYEQCSTEDLKFGTECLHLVQKYKKVDAKLVAGSSCLKVTYKNDLVTARGIIKENEGVSVVCGTSANMILCGVLMKSLLKKFRKVEGPSLTPNHAMTNFVLIHYKASISCIIDQGCKGVPISSCQPMSIVNITFDGNTYIDIQAVQRKAKEFTRQWKQQSLIYYVICKDSETSLDIVTETAELVTSLLYESNESLSGQIFIM